MSLNSLQYENKKKFISGFYDNFINSNEREQYSLLNEMVKNVEMKNSIDFYRPALNRYFVIINDVLDKIENKESVDYKKIICLGTQYWEILYGETDNREKYRIILIGEIGECQNAEKYVNDKVCDIVGYAFPSEMFPKRNDIDYFIVCGEIKNIAQTDRRIIRWDLIRFCFWGISPEAAYMRVKLEKQRCIKGAVTGLSYEQVGINWERLDRNLCCLASPSQDLFVDYKKFVWLHKTFGNHLKYCVIGMTDYALWYDLSLSRGKIRMLSSYDMIKDVHNFHDFDKLLIMWDEYKNVLGDLLIDNYSELEYIENFQPEKKLVPNTDQYVECDSNREKDIEEIKRIFSKPYEKTFIENKGILEAFLTYLKMNNIKALLYFPPFPDIFKRNIGSIMQKRTHNVINEFQKKYNFDILDLTYDKGFSDELFCDWSHLNAEGANLATEKINCYMDKIWGKSDCEKIDER